MLGPFFMGGLVNSLDESRNLGLSLELVDVVRGHHSWRHIHICLPGARSLLSEKEIRLKADRRGLVHRLVRWLLHLHHNWHPCRIVCLD